MKKNKYILPIIFLLFPISVWSQKSETKVIHYNWKEPAKIYTLPKALKEISGISVINDSLIGCIEDEHGIFYLYDLKKNKIQKEIKFSDDGDYEDLTIVKKDVYVLRNDGEIFKIENYQKKKPVLTHFPSLVPAHDNEGICYDKNSEKLLIACKGKFGKGLTNQFRREIHTYPLKGNKTDTLPLFIIKVDTLLNFAKREKIQLPTKIKNETVVSILKLRMSGLAIHPTTNDVYIVSSFDHAIFIFTQEGKLKNIQLLDEKIFPQSEGIHFSENGDLYISNEGKGILPTIVKISSIEK